MIRKLDRWVWIGGALLAANGGVINGVGLSCVAHQTVSHVTGTTTLVSLALAHGDRGALVHFGLILGSFFAGAALGGFVVENSALQLGHRYAAALWIECVLLLAAALTVGAHPSGGLDLAGCACGLQNAMASTYSGATLRTTHMTGIVTDIGAALGHGLRGLKVDWLRVRLYGTLLVSFMAGAVLGARLFSVLSFATLYLPAALTGALALAYSGYLHARVSSVKN